MTRYLQTYSRYLLLLLFCVMQLTGVLYAQEENGQDNENLPKALQRRMRNEHIRDSIKARSREHTPPVAVAAQALTETIDSLKATAITSADTLSLIDETLSLAAETIPTHDAVHEEMIVDSIALLNQQNLQAIESPVDTVVLMQNMPEAKKQVAPFQKKTWQPSPMRATWLAMVFPGGGQIYNRKYWKLPIIYGGFVGCAYALSWNGQMYSDYSQAYLDIMDDNPSTNSYLDLLPPGYNVDANLEYLKKVIKRRKDSFRRYRDLSIFCFIGVYLISVIDAYVDAELASFDISKDLTMRMEPAVITNPQNKNSSYGLQCSLRF